MYKRQLIRKVVQIKEEHCTNNVENVTKREDGKQIFGLGNKKFGKNNVIAKLGEIAVFENVMNRRGLMCARAHSESVVPNSMS